MPETIGALPVNGTLIHSTHPEGSLVTATMHGNAGEWVLLRANFSDDGVANITVSMSATEPCCSIWMTSVAEAGEIPDRQPKFGNPTRQGWQLLGYPRFYQVQAEQAVLVLVGSTQVWEAEVLIAGNLDSADATGGVDLRTVETIWVANNACGCLVGEARLARDTASLLIATWYEDVTLRSQVHEVNATFPDGSQRTAAGALAILSGYFIGSGWIQVTTPGETVMVTRMLTTSPHSMEPVIISMDWPDPWWGTTHPQAIRFFDSGRSEAP